MAYFRCPNCSVYLLLLINPKTTFIKRLNLFLATWSASLTLERKGEGSDPPGKEVSYYHVAFTCMCAFSWPPTLLDEYHGSWDRSVAGAPDS